MKITKSQRERFIKAIDHGTHEVSKKFGEPCVNIKWNEKIILQLREGIWGSKLSAHIETDERPLNNAYSFIEGWNGFLVSRAFRKKYAHLIDKKTKKIKDHVLLEEAMSYE